MDDPFASASSEEQFFSAAPDVSNYPKLDQLRGRLLLIRPTKHETGLLSSFSKPGQPQYQDRITADVIVLDGLVEGFEGIEFMDMYLSQTRLVSQLKSFVKSGGMCLGRLDTFKEGEPARAGNPWGLKTQYTPEDAELARKYLRGNKTD